MDIDLIILGGGLAGLTAGMYAARSRIPVALVEKGLPGGQMAATDMVENYPGFTEPVLGYELAQKMEEQARKFGLEIMQAEVSSVVLNDRGFVIATEGSHNFTCRALILATGASPKKMHIPGELELAGKGVSYCAVCDGPFFRDMEVAVVGGGDAAVEGSSLFDSLSIKGSSHSSPGQIASRHGNPRASIRRAEGCDTLEYRPVGGCRRKRSQRIENPICHEWIRR